ncbi:MAG: hypothetical protein EPO27_10390 [Betaproteobacteria bacterium]|nr:MAG: hypothetical protein EPO27_10390 [Betaproteobacteria bacterium]
MSNADRCALYVRSSKDRHDVSIDAQRRELLELAAKRGLAVAQEYADAVEAANDWSRPGFRQLLLDVARADRGWAVLLVLDTSRLARDVNLAGVFRHECRRRGVRVVFAKIPESNPLGDLITTHVYQLVDHIHSHMSREKGLAGMAENVRKGFRAGGRAPFGYALEAVETGAVRDGAPVTKSRLVPNADSAAIARYLKGRAAGLPGARLVRECGITLNPSTLVGIEWKALTYAGHTVWNVERAKGVGAGGYEGGAKRRPREEWIIQRDTHKALITEAEAEILLARLARKGATRMRNGDYLLSGILTAPDGRRWHGDQGHYRCGRRRLTAARLERQVLAAIAGHLGSDAIVRQAAQAARQAMKPNGRDVELRALQRQRDELERKLARLRNVMTEMRHPEALAPKVDELDEQKRAIETQAAAMVDELAGARISPLITEETVRTTLRGLAESLEGLDRIQLKARLRRMIERITVDPETLSCCLYYAIPAATGFSVATPRGFEPRLPP